MNAFAVSCLIIVAAAVVVFLARKRSTTPQQRQAEPEPIAAPATENPESPLNDAVRTGVRAFMKQHYEEAFELLEPPARQGNLKAQQLLAKMYYAGHGVPADREQYLYWLKRAADNGDKPSKAKVKKIEQGRTEAH
ncbi:MAG: hypothetical protein U5K56_13425 [Halioglobus sp.]|nr:hypothetical protein [Halioglobus sp.]